MLPPENINTSIQSETSDSVTSLTKPEDVGSTSIKSEQSDIEPTLSTLTLDHVTSTAESLLNNPTHSTKENLADVVDPVNFDKSVSDVRSIHESSTTALKHGLGTTTSSIVSKHEVEIIMPIPVSEPAAEDITSAFSISGVEGITPAIFLQPKVDDVTPISKPDIQSITSGSLSPPTSISSTVPIDSHITTKTTSSAVTVSEKTSDFKNAVDVPGIIATAEKIPETGSKSKEDNLPLIEKDSSAQSSISNNVVAGSTQPGVVPIDAQSSQGEPSYSESPEKKSDTIVHLQKESIVDDVPSEGASSGSGTSTEQARVYPQETPSASEVMEAKWRCRRKKSQRPPRKRSLHL